MLEPFGKLGSIEAGILTMPEILSRLESMESCLCGAMDLYLSTGKNE